MTEQRPNKIKSYLGGNINTENLSTYPTDAAGQLYILGYDGHPLSMDGAEVGVLEQTDQVSLTGLLESSNGRALEPEIRFEILRDFPDEPLEGKFTDEKLRGLLVAPDFPESHSAGPVAVRLLDAP